jgi:hypothetical protein
MSTRCQVQVIGTGEDADKVTLYHHTDGYPSFMVPLIAKAYRHAVKPSPDGYARAWQAARVGKSAGQLCWAHPGKMEPEAGHDLHGDIAYLYLVYISGAMDTGATGRWEVEILVPRARTQFDPPGGKRFWDHPSVHLMDVHTPRTEVLALSRRIVRAERKRRKADVVSA